eukprot:SAG31_NODE_143_length_22627_cov_14.541347_14_plen_295_part_00
MLKKLPVPSGETSENENDAMQSEADEVETALRDIAGTSGRNDGKIDFESFFKYWQRINSSDYDKTWWDAHWPKVAASALFLAVLITVIIGIAAISSSQAGTVLTPPAPPPIPPQPQQRVAPPVEIRYSFSFPPGYTSAQVEIALTVYLGLSPPAAVTKIVPPTAAATNPMLWSTEIQAPTIQRAADIFNALCAASTPGASSVPDCQTGAQDRRRQQLATVSFVFISTSFGEYIENLISYKEYQVDQMHNRLLSLYENRCSAASNCASSSRCTAHACRHTGASFSCVQETFGTPR